jgi:hypothetical protein
MSNRFYTNTSNPVAILGLFVTTVALSYASQNADQIVNATIKGVIDGVSILKDAAKKATNNGKQKYHVLGQDFDGKIYDTGRIVYK